MVTTLIAEFVREIFVKMTGLSGRGEVSKKSWHKSTARMCIAGLLQDWTLGNDFRHSFEFVLYSQRTSFNNSCNFKRAPR